MVAKIRLRNLEGHLQQVTGFQNPKVSLEQYGTPAHLGAHMLYTAQTHFNDINGKLIGDFGCGCGVLSIGAALLGASNVIGLEIDTDALDLCQTNSADQDLIQIDYIQCDIVKQFSPKWKFETIVMNPPFGTKSNTGIDMKFLEIALQCTSNAVYSLHKTTTRNHVLKVAESLGANGEVLAELKFDLPRTYKFHKQATVDINVDFFRFTVC